MQQMDTWKLSTIPATLWTETQLSLSNTMTHVALLFVVRNDTTNLEIEWLL